MKQPRSQSIVVLAAAACLIVVLTITGLVFWHTPAVQAQASTNTPRPGIQTLLTPAVQATRPTAPSPGPILAPIPAGTSTAQGPVATSAAVSPAPTSSALAPSATTPITNTRAMTLTSSSPGAGTITVVGEGQVKIQPDIARVNIGVETVDPTVKGATSQARTIMQAVTKAIKGAGVADKDIQTANFNIFTERIQPTTGGSTGEQVRYHASNSATVIVRNLDQVGDVLDAAIEAGANNIYGVTFSVEDPLKAESLARQRAVADAQQRAAELAQLNGVQVGPVVSVSEVIGDQAVLMANSLREAAVPQGAGGSGNVQPGELELTMLLQITYAMQ